MKLTATNCVNRINGKGKWRTVVAEQETLSRTLLSRVIRLDERFEVVRELEDGLEAREACLEQKPDLVVTGIHLPKLDGIDLARVLARELPQTRILLLSERDDSLTLSRVAEIQVHGYITRDEPWEILEEAMIEVASGRTYFSAAYVRTQQILRRDSNGFAKILSRREREILSWVASGRTSRMIARHLNLSHRSIETYRYRIMRKLEIENLAGLIDYAFRNGFVQSPESRTFAGQLGSRRIDGIGMSYNHDIEGS